MFQFILPRYSLTTLFPVNLTLRVDHTKVFVGESVTAIVTVNDEVLDPPISNADVEVYVEGVVNKVFHGLTDSNGIAIFYLKFNQTGTYKIKAVFPKQLMYSTASTDYVTIRVYKRNPMGGTILFNYSSFLLILIASISAITLLIPFFLHPR